MLGKLGESIKTAAALLAVLAALGTAGFAAFEWETAIRDDLNALRIQTEEDSKRLDATIEHLLKVFAATDASVRHEYLSSMVNDIKMSTCKKMGSTYNTTTLECTPQQTEE